MSHRTYAIEAEECRSWANDFNGRPEQAFLLRVANEFDKLAQVANAPCNIHEGNLPYFAQRASQEITAAVKAKNPKARLAHLTMAQRYEALTLDRRL